MRKFYLVIVGLLVGILAFSGNCYAASYTVKPGDTLYKIAVNNGTTVDTLTSLNNLNSTMIYPGDVLQLPDSGQTPGSAQQYTVQPGDTLYLISKAYGTTVDAIMSQNNLSSTVIYPGQVLLIPGSGQAPPSSTAPTGATQQYTVQPGDTLYLISRAYCTTVDAIMSQNNLSSTVIYPGQVLQVPGSGQAPSKSPPSTGSTQQYTVQPGDTLYLISRAYCTTVDAIMSQNNLSSTVIYPGQVLQVPGNSSTTPSRGGRGSYSAEERYLLAQIISAEAAGEIFEGQVAVGAVILNRITDYRFPNNLWDVIYEPWQFEPVQNGTINLPPVSSAIRAADAALDGWDPVDGAVYFCNPDTAQSTDFFRTLTYVRRIGNHVFYR
ncbi:LysM peptidoglycan-binding domain-containing protein [Syntrophaceticus schinkii]|jgi:N-acetylmuramoyl-L-alanine amidase|uniref:Cell wall hydrolase SleB n=1 Tax=Syntrophaceticus schinkii TaxID=499207 RepID=A0A0B7MR17_9FIRM